RRRWGDAHRVVLDLATRGRTGGQGVGVGDVAGEEPEARVGPRGRRRAGGREGQLVVGRTGVRRYVDDHPLGTVPEDALAVEVDPAHQGRRLTGVVRRRHRHDVVGSGRYADRVGHAVLVGAVTVRRRTRRTVDLVIDRAA